MFIAKNQDGERIWADSATKSEKYSCPCCGGEVTLRDGPINAAHLAHIGGECRDSWHYDMPEWHKSMQALFGDGYALFGDRWGIPWAVCPFEFLFAL